jgi:hypothetical protein
LYSISTVVLVDGMRTPKWCVMLQTLHLHSPS